MHLADEIRPLLANTPGVTVEPLRSGPTGTENVTAMAHVDTTQFGDAAKIARLLRSKGYAVYRPREHKAILHVSPK